MTVTYQSITASLLLHLGVFAALNNSYSGFEFDTGPETRSYSSLNEALEENTCTENPDFRLVSDEEQEFVDVLVSDLVDGHLDSMPFGEFMIRSEVYTHNSEQYCEENLWSEREELDWYKGFEDFVIEQTSLLGPREASEEIFHILHFGSSEDNEYLFPVLEIPKDEQARPIIARKTGEFNCDVGTKWFTALADAHQLIDDVKIRDYIGHKSSVILIGTEELNFENTSYEGVGVKPKRKGDIRPLEVFVVEYLRGLGVPLEDFAEEFAKLYDSNEARSDPRLIRSRTNGFGAPILGSESLKTREEELRDVPRNYPSLQRGSKSSIVWFDRDKYDWLAIGELAIKKSQEFSKDPHWYKSEEFYDLLDLQDFVLNQVFFNTCNGKKGYEKYSKDPRAWERDFNNVRELRAQALENLFTELTIPLNPEREGFLDRAASYQKQVVLYLSYATPSIEELSTLIDVEGFSGVGIRFVAVSDYFDYNYERLIKEEGGEELYRKVLNKGERLIEDGWFKENYYSNLMIHNAYLRLLTHDPKKFQETIKAEIVKPGGEFHVNFLLYHYEMVYPISEELKSLTKQIIERELKGELEFEEDFRVYTQTFCKERLLHTEATLQENSELCDQYCDISTDEWLSEVIPVQEALGL